MEAEGRGCIDLIPLFCFFLFVWARRGVLLWDVFYLFCPHRRKIRSRFFFGLPFFSSSEILRFRRGDVEINGSEIRNVSRELYIQQCLCFVVGWSVIAREYLLSCGGGGGKTESHLLLGVTFVFDAFRAMLMFSRVSVRAKKLQGRYVSTKPLRPTLL